MARAKDKRENHVSLLVMPDDEGQRQAELYYWYDGNPFGLHERKSAILGFSDIGAVLTDEPVKKKQRETFNELLFSVGGVAGYIIAKKNFMVVGVPSEHWTKVSREVLRFFPTDKAIYSRVPDENNKIANTKGFAKRAKRVRGAEGKFATKQLPEVHLKKPAETKGFPYSKL